MTIDLAEAVANGEREAGRPLTLDEIKDYRHSALLLAWDREGQGDPIGIQSLEVWTDHLEELPAAEGDRLYKERTPADSRR